MSNNPNDVRHRWCGLCKSEIPQMEREDIEEIGMPLVRWRHESCVATFAVGDDWATLYEIQSGEEGRGHATQLLVEAKSFYENSGKRFGGTVALNTRMHKIYKRLGITEYDGDDGGE